MTTVMREQFSSQFPFSQRVRSMNSVSFAMLKAEKAKERFVSDAAV